MSGNLIWTELKVKEKNTSKTIISQILKPEMQIRKQKVTESKRFRPKRRADKKTTQIISGNLIWTELMVKEKKYFENDHFANLKT